MSSRQINKLPRHIRRKQERELKKHMKRKLRQHEKQKEAEQRKRAVLILSFLNCTQEMLCQFARLSEQDFGQINPSIVNAFQRMQEDVQLVEAEMTQDFEEELLEQYDIFSEQTMRIRDCMVQAPDKTREWWTTSIEEDFRKAKGGRL